MTHLTEDDLVLHYYGEAPAGTDAEAHLRTCVACAAEYAALGAMLARVTAPAPPDPDPRFWRDLRAGVIARAAHERTGQWLAALVWLIPLVYPFSPPATYYSAQFERVHGIVLGMPLVLLALGWALAGPFVAMFALTRLPGSRIHSATARLVVYGALVSTVSPSLFNLVMTRGLGIVGWYAVIALAAAAAFIPVRESAQPSPRLRRVHRWSAVAIVVFGTVHVINHTLAIVSVATHSAVLEVLRLVYRAPVIEGILFAVIAVQIGTGATLLWRAHLRQPSVTRNVQALSGVYLAVFFMVHITAALIARPAIDTNFIWAAGKDGLLASPRLTFLLPDYLLGIAAFLAHLGAYLRIRYASVMPAVSVQRLSYAGMAFSGAVVLTVGLALCGIRLMP